MRTLKTLNTSAVKKVLAVVNKNLDKIQATGTLDIDDAGSAILVLDMKRFDPREALAVKKAEALTKKRAIPRKGIKPTVFEANVQSVTMPGRTVIKLLKMDAKTGLPLKGQAKRIATSLGMNPLVVAGYIAAYVRKIQNTKK